MSELAQHIETVAKALLGEPNAKLSSKSELRWGNGHAVPHDTVRTSLVATYPYCDEHGEVTYEVCRFEPKTFKQRRVVNGKAIWGLGDTDPLPYKLPDIINNPTKPILVVEGEKDADSLANLGFVATCNSGGFQTMIRLVRLMSALSWAICRVKPSA